MGIVIGKSLKKYFVMAISAKQKVAYTHTQLTKLGFDMSYIQSVYNRLADNIIERCVEGWEVSFSESRFCLGLTFPQHDLHITCWEIWHGGGSIYVNCVYADSNYLGEDIIAIGELVNAMNAIAHKDFMEALSEKDGCDE